MTVAESDPSRHDGDIDALYATAAAELADACAGWRGQRRCTDALGRREPHPHPGCLRAQYRHDLLLLEHGLLAPPA